MPITFKRDGLKRRLSRYPIEGMDTDAWDGLQDCDVEDVQAVLEAHPEIAEKAGWTSQSQGWEHVFAMQERRPERLRQLLRDRVKILYEELCLYEDTDLDEIMILVSNTGPWLDAACEALLAEGSE